MSKTIRITVNFGDETVYTTESNPDTVQIPDSLSESLKYDNGTLEPLSVTNTLRTIAAMKVYPLYSLLLPSIQLFFNRKFARMSMNTSHQSLRANRESRVRIS